MQQRLTSGLLKHGFLLLAATQVANVCNILFQAAMGRLLPPAEYGILLAMLGLALIIVTPLQAITTVSAHYTARLVHEGRIAEVSSYIRFWALRLAIPATLLATLGLVGADYMRHFFHLSSGAPLRLTLVAVAVSMFVPPFVGALQGLQRFGWMATTAYAWAVVRLVGAVLLAARWRPVAMAGLWAQAFGVAASVGCGLAAMTLICEARGRRLEALVGVHRYFVSSLVVLSGFALLTYLDVPLVKHYFTDPVVAGMYSRASVIGRAAFFLPMPIAQALFPKVTSAGVISGEDRHNLIKALALTVILTGGAALAFSLFPQIPLGLLFGQFRPDPGIASLTRAAIWAMAPLSILFLLLNFEMAQHRFGLALAIVPAAAAFVVGTAIWHKSPFEILGVLGATALITVALISWGIIRACRPGTRVPCGG